MERGGSRDWGRAGTGWALVRVPDMQVVLSLMTQPPWQAAGARTAEKKVHLPNWPPLWVPLGECLLPHHCENDLGFGVVKGCGLGTLSPSTSILIIARKVVCFSLSLEHRGFCLLAVATLL